jgi:hypothetical protein
MTGKVGRIGAVALAFAAAASAIGGSGEHAAPGEPVDDRFRECVEPRSRTVRGE